MPNSIICLSVVPTVTHIGQYFSQSDSHVAPHGNVIHVVDIDVYRNCFMELLVYLLYGQSPSSVSKCGKS
jgi:hypothetical protein